LLEDPFTPHLPALLARNLRPSWIISKTDVSSCRKTTSQDAGSVPQGRVDRSSPCSEQSLRGTRF